MSSKVKISFSKYHFGKLNKYIKCSICFRKTRSFSHRCLMLSPSNIIIKNNEKKNFSKFKKFQAPLFVAVKNMEKIFHSLECFKHLESNKYIFINHVLYEKCLIPDNFTFKQFITILYDYPIENKFNKCKHY